jgi:hypothetical protein
MRSEVEKILGSARALTPSESCRIFITEGVSMTRDEFEKQIIVKALKDAAFREELKKDPKGILHRELQNVKAGITLPDNLKVTVVEETPDHIYLRLPVAPSSTMNEKELAGMTGGSSQPTVNAVQAVSIDITTAVSIDVSAVSVTATEVVISGGPVVVV